MKFICLVALLCPQLSFGQLKPLAIGDVLPQEYLSATVTGNSKLIILDFFATWCTGCIKNLPRFDSLQQRFADKLQIVIVTNEPPEKIEAFRKKNKVFAGCQLPVVTADTMLHKLFPHYLIPHEVWIDTKGMVAAITSDEEVIATNISDMIAARQIHLRSKKDLLDFDYHKPILHPHNGINENIVLARSLITTSIDGLGSMEGMAWSADSATKRFFYINRQIAILYSIAGRPMSYDPNDKVLYSYELTVPSSMTKEQAMQWMLQDLDRYFLHHKMKSQ